MIIRTFFKFTRRSRSENKEVEEAMGEISRSCKRSSRSSRRIPSNKSMTNSVLIIIIINIIMDIGVVIVVMMVTIILFLSFDYSYFSALV